MLLGTYNFKELRMSISHDRMVINTFSGPDRSIRNQEIHKLKILARRYRNRRIGEFLKELDMTERQGTGITNILKSVEQNKSPTAPAI